METQRDICGSYIRSQQCRGWVELPQRYDDGGYSGSNLERPEFHGWGSRVGDLERPDRLVIDLGPDEALNFEMVRDAAFEVGDQFSRRGLLSFPMLSGGKGVHVLIALRPVLNGRP